MNKLGNGLIFNVLIYLSIKNNINTDNHPIHVGLYSKDDVISPLNKAIVALVRPQPGQSWCKNTFIGQRLPNNNCIIMQYIIKANIPNLALYKSFNSFFIIIVYKT